jgi:hypothetical protein
MTTSHFGRFFQLGYVARDLDAAIAEFPRRFGPAEFQIVNADQPNIATKRIALTWIGATMIELIEPSLSMPSIYLDAVPAHAGDIRFHHTGHLVDDYPAATQRFKAEGYEVPMFLSYGTVLDCCYADARDRLGHYLECIRLGEEGRRWFSSVPGFQRFPPD